ncbi:MAG: hypothetical protein H7Y88_04460 [Phycisphaerales bacterium]|nr:hypothetical protein [Phycisphaerales bacterium]
MISGTAIALGLALFVVTIVILSAVLLRSPRLRRATNEAGWVVECSKCGAVTAAGDAGIIRIGAASKGKLVGARCPACGKLGMLRMRKR